MEADRPLAVAIAPKPVDTDETLWKKNKKLDKFCGFVGRSRAKKLSASEGFAPDPHQGLCPWTLLGTPPPDTRYRLVLHALAMGSAP